MSHIPTQEDLRKILRDLKEVGVLPDLEKLVQLRGRTIYRQAEEDPEHGMSPRTRGELARVFGEVGLLDAQDFGAFMAGVGEIQRQAAKIRDTGGSQKDRGGEAESARRGQDAGDAAVEGNGDAV